MLELDHVVIAAADLEAAALVLEEQYGLLSQEGGRHPGWGTANRIVLLGEAYLELVAVVDADEAAASGFGRWVAAARPEPLQPLGWAVRTDELDEVAKRLELDVIPGSRRRTDGTVVRWRLAGADHAAVHPELPFFIEWAPETSLPGSAAVTDVRITSLRVAGDTGRLAAWLGPNDLPLEIVAGRPGIAGLDLSGGEGQRDRRIQLA
jgi:glyoxalase-like protein